MNRRNLQFGIELLNSTITISNKPKMQQFLSEATIWNNEFNRHILTINLSDDRKRKNIESLINQKRVCMHVDRTKSQS